MGLVGQVPSTPIKIPRTEYKVPSYPGAFLITWGLVQDELDLDPSVIADLEKSRQVQSARVEAMTKPPTSFQPYRYTVGPAVAHALDRLTNSQKKRLGEIYLQYYDVNALADPTVADMVGLSKDQRIIVQSKLNQAHHRYQAAQEAMFERFRKDNEELRKKAAPAKSGDPIRARIVYTVPRDVQNSHTDLSRVVNQIQLQEMAKARTAIRANLTRTQRSKFEGMKGRPIPHVFYDGSNWGTAGPHLDLALNIHVQAEMGFSLKEYLEIQRETQGRPLNPRALSKLIARLKPAQLKKLRQYELQYDREYSVLRHDVARELGIDRGTVDRMRLRLEEIEVKSRREADKLWLTADPSGQPSSQSYEARGRVLDAADQEKRRAILELMTVEQKKRWGQMLGKPLPEIQPSRSFG